MSSVGMAKRWSRQREEAANKQDISTLKQKMLEHRTTEHHIKDLKFNTEAQ